MVVEIWRDQFTDAKKSRVQVEPRVHLACAHARTNLNQGTIQVPESIRGIERCSEVLGTDLKDF